MPENLQLLISSEQIRHRVEQLGQEITEFYKSKGVGQGESLIVLSLLKGSIIFAADLIRNLDLPIKLHFMEVSSYGEATESSGQVNILCDLNYEPRHEHILIVEDIVDTGLTLEHIIGGLHNSSPHSVEIATLLYKKDKAKLSHPVRFAGFTIKDEFVVGYGLDYQNRYRNLSYIAVLHH